MYRALRVEAMIALIALCACARPALRDGVPGTTFTGGGTEPWRRAETDGRAEPLQRYLNFARQKRDELNRPGTSDRERRSGQRALSRLLAWAVTQPGRVLASREPWKEYLDIVVRVEHEAERADARDEAVLRKRDEYHAWALRALAENSVTVSSPGRAYLLTESALRGVALDVLTKAVLEWADDNQDSPLFLQRSPSEVALYLLAKHDGLAEAVHAGLNAPPQLEYFEHLDRSRYTPGQLALETLVSLAPFIGNLSDAAQALEGTSLTGHELETSDRVLLAVGALIPLRISLLEKGPGLLERLVIASGRGAEEIEAIFRMARHLTPEEVSEVDRLIRAVAKGQKVGRAELEALEKIALRLEGPMQELVKAVSQGRRLSVDLVTGAKLIPGTSEHMMQRWIDYQFTHLERFRGLTRVVDPKWEKQYWTILKNSKMGPLYQREALGHFGFEKNTLMMMPPPGVPGTGFIPDAVKGRPRQLIWGVLYHFVEVKGRNVLGNTGNVEAMISYVGSHPGSSLTLIVRSSEHPDGPTRLWGSLKRVVDRLPKGAVTIKYCP